VAYYFIAQDACRRGSGVNRFQLHARLRCAVLRGRPEVSPQPTFRQQPVVEVDDTVFELELGEEPLRPAELGQKPNGLQVGARFVHGVL
jgi:hypothetical protein